MNSEPLPFMASFYLIDSAAMLFADRRTSRHPGQEELDIRCRSILRKSAVEALRFLWRTGDSSQRRTVICRVRIWMGRHDSEAGKELTCKLGEREISRQLKVAA